MNLKILNAFQVSKYEQSGMIVLMQQCKVKEMTFLQVRKLNFFNECNWMIFLSHTHDIAICFGLKKTIKINKLVRYRACSFVDYRLDLKQFVERLSTKCVA